MCVPTGWGAVSSAPQRKRWFGAARSVGAAAPAPQVASSAAMRRTFRHCGAVLMALVAAACASDPAPEAITDVSHWLWRNYATATEERLADAVVALSGTVTQVTADKPLKALIAGLVPSDVALTGRTDVQASQVRGLLVVTEFGCKLSQIKKIHTAPNQDTLHPGAFKTYKRTYTQSRDAFVAGQLARLDWVSDITGDYGDGAMLEGARMVPDLGKVQTPFGAALVGRSWLKAAATGSDWKQDYEVDLYFERSPGRVVHMVAAWRQATFAGFDMDTAFLQNIMLGSLVNWDKEIEKACQSGSF